MVKRSDVNERLPRFHEAMDAVNTLEKKGGLEGVPGYVTKYLRGAVPVGLDNEGIVVLPDDYAPENGPPVLMLRSQEVYRNFGLRGSDSEIETAYAIAFQARVKPANIDKEILNRPLDLDSKVDFPAGVRSSKMVSPALRRSGRPSSHRYNFMIPRLLTVSSEERIAPDRLGEVMAHEADHWDFYLNEAGHLQRDPKRQLSREEMVAIAEKRGYATSRKIKENLGHYARLGYDDPIERFASIIHKRHPRNPTDILRLSSEYTKDSTDNVAALAVFAITTAFGKKGKLVTKKELEAYKLLGIVESD